MISIENLIYFYNYGKKNEYKAIDNITLELPEKGIVALYGKSGSGKTTLLNCIGGLAETNHGKIHICGEDLSENTDYLRNKHIGYIFQNYNLIPHESVFENIAYTLKIAGIKNENTIKQLTYSALKSVGMEKYASRYPCTLSGGQQQRVAIARAIVKRPQIILADEPTGNLDKINTSLVMNILHEISKEQLVVLVTHDYEIVEKYSSLIVNISEGKVVDIKVNDRYSPDFPQESLGEKNRHLVETNHRVMTPFGTISYFGDLPEEPLNINIVREKEQFYLSINIEKTKFVDEACDYLNAASGAEYEQKNMLPKFINQVKEVPITDIDVSNIGKLFDFKSSIKNGFYSLRGTTRNNKVLRLCLSFMAIILVLITGFYGTALNEVLETKKKNNTNVFYAYVPDQELLCEIINSTENETSGIDSIVFSNSSYCGDDIFNIKILQPESSQVEYSEDISNISFHAAQLKEELSEDFKLVSGNRELIDVKDVLITSAVADYIIDNSKISYISSYDVLIGLSGESITNEDGFKIVGVVKSDEFSVYRNQHYFANKIFKKVYSCGISTDDKYNYELSPGKVIIRISDNIHGDNPKEGQSISLNGIPLEVSKVINVKYSYEDWLNDNSINKALNDGQYSEYEYLDYYYHEYMDYVTYCSNNKGVVEYDKYKELILNGCIEAWYASVTELTGNYDYYYASCFKKDYGYYPNDSELEASYFYYDSYDTILDAYLANEDDIYNKSCEYMLNKQDYEACGIAIGNTTGYGLEKVSNIEYCVIHSNNTKLTEKYLSDILSDKKPSPDWRRTYITPQYLYSLALANEKGAIISSLTVYLIMIALMSLCIYMLMKGIVNSRVRTIGLCRSIGVKSKNIKFSFVLEILITVMFTSVIGYTVTSFVLWCLQSGKYASIISDVIYYPLWLGIILLLFIITISMVVGMIPMIMLLRKSPSEILSKYDI